MRIDKCYGEKMIAAGTAAAFQLAQQYSPDDLALIGLFLNALGDQLSLLSVTKAACKAQCDKVSAQETII